VNWKTLKDIITRNWQVKLLSLLLAFLLWFMIKAQANRTLPFGSDRAPRASRL
jgi:YbbR domain-containing protein